MSSIVVAGDVSGSVTLSAPSAAGSVVVTLPSASGTMAVTGGSPSFATLTVTGDATISGLTVGKGYGTLAYNTAFGITALGSSSLTGNYNTAVGYLAGSSTTSGAQNTFTGRIAGSANTTGSFNAAFGDACLNSNTTGSNNTSVGQGALTANTTASNNTAVGYQSLYSSNRGDTLGNNTAIGRQSGYSNSTGIGNLFAGSQAGYFSSTASYNTFVGSQDSGGLPVAYYNTTGSYNVALGGGALTNNTTASFNTALGYQALYANTGAGEQNTAIGFQAGIANTTSSYSTFIGALAGNVSTGTFNTFVGRASGYYVTSGTKNTILGSYSGNSGGLDIRTASNYIVLSDGDGNPKLISDPQGCVVIPGYGAPSVIRTGDASLSVYKSANTLRVAHFQNNYDVTGAECIRTVIGANANNTTSYHLIASTGASDKYYLYGNGTYATVSDQRLKKNIEAASDGFLEDVAKLRVVKYNWTDDAENTPKELGWIAQEVEQVFPRLVQDCLPNENGDVYKTVKSSVLPYILLKAIQELNAKVTALEAQLAAK